MPTYVVTGASSGIGLEVVRQLAARGDKVFATVRKRENSATGEDFISSIAGDVTVVEGIDVAKDDVGARLAASALAGVVIDGIIHNAGGFNGARDEDKDMSGQMKDQQLGGVSADRMISAFNQIVLVFCECSRRWARRLPTTRGRSWSSALGSAALETTAVEGCTLIAPARPR